MTAPPSPRPDDALHVALTLAAMLGERQGRRGCRTILRVARVVGLPATKPAARETLTVPDDPRVRSGTQGRAAGDRRRPGAAPPPADRQRAPDPTDA